MNPAPRRLIIVLQLPLGLEGCVHDNGAGYTGSQEVAAVRNVAVFDRAIASYRLRLRLACFFSACAGRKIDSPAFGSLLVFSDLDREWRYSCKPLRKADNESGRDMLHDGDRERKVRRKPFEKNSEGRGASCRGADGDQSSPRPACRCQLESSRIGLLLGSEFSRPNFCYGFDP